MLCAPAFIRAGRMARMQEASPIAVSHHSSATVLESKAVLYTGRHSSSYLVDMVEKFEVDDTIVGQLVDRAIMEITGKESVSAAWESLFPPDKLDTNTRIAIKINHSYGVSSEDGQLNHQWLYWPCPVGPKPAVVDAIVDGLCQMLGGTFPIRNIVVFDANCYLGPTKMAIQGFPVSRDFYNYEMEATDANPRIELYDREGTPLTAPSFEAGVSDNTVEQRIIPPVCESDFLINVGVPKVHQAAGMTGCFKNLYGCTDDCGSTHGSSIDSEAPGVAPCIPKFYEAINAVTPVVINIYDALVGSYNGNASSWSRYFQQNIIAASRDPVALDSFGLHMINSERVKNGFHAIAAHDTGVYTESPAEPWPLWPGSYNEDGYVNAEFLSIAAGQYMLGNLNYSLLNAGPMTAVRNPVPPSLDTPQSALSKAIRTPHGWRLHIATDNSGRLHTIEARIVNLKGCEVRSLKTVKTYARQSVIDWDGSGNGGSHVAAGVYSWEIRVDGRLRTRTVVSR